jgi:hypothetical protein
MKKYQKVKIITLFIICFSALLLVSALYFSGENWATANLSWDFPVTQSKLTFADKIFFPILTLLYKIAIFLHIP